MLVADSQPPPVAAAPLISVIMPVYNAARYVREAVQSILDQSFTDFELIIIDDGSSDDSLSILKEFAARDRRIRLCAAFGRPERNCTMERPSRHPRSRRGVLKRPRLRWLAQS